MAMAAAVEATLVAMDVEATAMVMTVAEVLAAALRCWPRRGRGRHSHGVLATMAMVAVLAVEALAAVAEVCNSDGSSVEVVAVGVAVTVVRGD